VTGRFDSFVILADMRTGSNALEEQLNDFADLQSHGEVFNPHFVGHSGKTGLFGVDLDKRDLDPRAMLATLSGNTNGLAGFRLFSDHDRRVLDLCLAERARAKIILTRAPLDSYISLKIARKTGQWWLSDLKSAKTGKARFDLAEFQRYLAARSEWLTTIRRSLQRSGQTAFDMRHEDLGEPDVIEGLARFLGSKGEIGNTTRKGRMQNPVPMSEKVENFAEMKEALQKIDAFDLDAVASFEPARGPNVPSYVASPTAGLIYTPIKCAEDQVLLDWMAALEGGNAAKLDTGLTQRSLRQWKRRQGPHLSFAVVAHPLARAHDAFCRFILPTGTQAFTGIRDVLIRSYKLPLPDDPGDASYGAAEHHAAFLAFLKFLKGNLGGQTSVRIDSAWTSQENALKGLAGFAPLDAVLRADRLRDDLANLAQRIGIKAPDLPAPASPHPFALADIYDPTIERAARAAYQRDYMMFGFGAWSETAQDGI
jgi:hypothetical protein